MATNKTAYIEKTDEGYFIKSNTETKGWTCHQGATAEELSSALEYLVSLFEDGQNSEVEINRY